MSFTAGPIPRATCISCAFNFVQEVFHTCLSFVDILKKDFLEFFPVVGLRSGQKNSIKFLHICYSLIFTPSALLFYVILRRIQRIK